MLYEMQQGILVRIGVDHSYGGWNAPVDPSSGRFVYVPIPEGDHVAFHKGCARPYTEIEEALQEFAESVGQDLFQDLRCPPTLFRKSMHLDPDFQHLTYGDVGDKRGSEIARLKHDDILVFYAGLRPCKPVSDRLIYAIVGLFVVDEVVQAVDVPRHRFHENAHTRKVVPGATDIVVRAKPGVSGRLDRCIPIGEYRNRAYRVKQSILDAWGGLSVNDGYIQRSARPPRFVDPARFMTWFDRHSNGLIRSNYPAAVQDKVVIVHLRRPRNEPNETRSDPFYEFGSFGCTGCHSNNLMHPDRINELEGVRLAFAQGGSGGFRLVLLTSPVRIEQHKNRCELRWDPLNQPFRYDRAPLLVDNTGRSDFPMFKRILAADRTTWCGAFSSLFRTRRRPLNHNISNEMIGVYESFVRSVPQAAFAQNYADTMPYPPNTIDHDRFRSYNRFLKDAKGQRLPRLC